MKRKRLKKGVITFLTTIYYLLVVIISGKMLIDTLDLDVVSFILVMVLCGIMFTSVNMFKDYLENLKIK